MKIRSGFVSNSSSSSYVCEVSGEAFEVQDACFRDAGLAQCKAGHYFQTKFLVPWEPKFPEREEMIEQLVERTDSKKECAAFPAMQLSELMKRYSAVVMGLDGSSDNQYYANEHQCPICSMIRIKDSDILKYVLKRFQLTRGQVVDIIQSDYAGDYANFQKAINSN